MKRVVSVSIGSSKRDKKVEVDCLGETVSIERVGTDGSFDKALKMIGDLDGQVDAIGLGGIDLYLVVGKRRYVIRDAQRLANAAKATPVLDGSGLKNTLERETVNRLSADGTLFPTDLGGRKPRVLVVSAVDRFGMAEAFSALHCDLILGDLIFGLGIPVALRSLRAVRVIAFFVLPILCRRPFEQRYPTGEKQEEITPKYRKYFDWADVIGGDFHFIHRYMPPPPSAKGEAPPLKDKVIITNTVTESDVEELRARGLKRLVATTPEFEGRSFGTNAMEGVVVALAGRPPSELKPEDYLELLDRLGWKPRVEDLA